jgi:lysozyme
MDTKAVLDMIKKDEGWVSHAYQDHLGFWTIGYGFLIDQRRGGGIPKEVAEYWLQHIVHGIVNDLSKRLSFFQDLPDAIQQCLVNMAYQLGTNGLLSFRKMMAALENGNYQQAAIEALDSRWAQQTPNRANRIAVIIASA